MQLGWIDFSKEDRQKVYDVMNLLHEQGAVDELGIGIIRDAFANYFFPGTSTIQTRAKYFLIVPYVIKEVVGKSKANSNVESVLNSINTAEHECGKILYEKEPNEDGVIGRRVLPNGWVSRTPSEIYWSGIRTFGIFKDNNLSIKEYISLALKLKKEKAMTKLGNRGDDLEDSERDDSDAGDITNFHFWNVPTYTSDWKNNLTIELTPEEATFLRKQITESVPGSLLTYILKNNINLNNYDSFLSLAEGIKGDVSGEMAEMLALASDFNYLVYMARVRYNIILSEGKNQKASDEWNWLSNDLKKRSNVDLNAIIDKLKIDTPQTFIFLKKLQQLFMNGEIDEADQLIRKREIQLKGINRAKLNRTKEYSADDWIGGFWLNYRFQDARRIVNDIYSGEGSQNV